MSVSVADHPPAELLQTLFPLLSSVQMDCNGSTREIRSSALFGSPIRRCGIHGVNVAGCALIALLLLPFAALGQRQVELEPEPTLSPAESAAQGKKLVSDILSQVPSQALTNSGMLIIRDRDDNRITAPVQVVIIPGLNQWTNRYHADFGTNSFDLTIVHSGAAANTYQLTVNSGGNVSTRTLSGNETMIPFAQSDFWVADLGLEFFHWPAQRVLKSEIRKTRAAKVLESVNPHPAPGAYLRVVSWIDTETGGIIHAEAYDHRNKLLKEFDTKKFRKVHGQWQLEEMQISNVQADSRSQIEFTFDTD